MPLKSIAGINTTMAFMVQPTLNELNDHFTTSKE